jgi:GntR family transcriptional regulator, transcriptional repressor for pyruvate dehydrogenase complex
MNLVRRRSTIVEDIAEELRAMILTGQIQPGQFLEPQKALADRLGVGLSTVRESIQLLAAVGLVESHPGKGTWVRQDALDKVFNPTAVKTRLGNLNARQVYEARLVIEVGLTRFAAQRATEEDIQRIWQTIHAMETAAGDEDVFVQSDLEFHLAVARAGHNDLLEQFYHLVRELLSEVITEMVMLPRVKGESILLQRTIAEAIEAHDVPSAQEAAQAHMHYIEELLKTYG